METFNLLDYINGWFIGDFDPTIINAKDFEIAIKRYEAGDSDQNHYHKLSEEITVVVNGTVQINGTLFNENDIIFIKKNEPAKFYAITDCVTCVIKIPSSKNDKFIVESTTPPIKGGA